jgi:hypothetical protein
MAWRDSMVSVCFQIQNVTVLNNHSIKYLKIILRKEDLLSNLLVIYLGNIQLCKYILSYIASISSLTINL